jgi:hypothetical protein
VCGSLHASDELPPGEMSPMYQMEGRLGELQNRRGEENIIYSTGARTPTPQSFSIRRDYFRLFHS